MCRARPHWEVDFVTPSQVSSECPRRTFTGTPSNSPSIWRQSLPSNSPPSFSPTSPGEPREQKKPLYKSCPHQGMLSTPATANSMSGNTRSVHPPPPEDEDEPLPLMRFRLSSFHWHLFPPKMQVSNTPTRKHGNGMSRT